MRKNYKIYISGQITGLSEKDYTQNFKDAEIELLDFRTPEEIINPLDIKPLFGIKKWFFFMVADIWRLLKCADIYMLENWQNSKCAKIEHRIAKMLKINVIYQ